MDAKRYVILVDGNDNQIGIEEKIKAHSNGARLHRALSIFVFNKKGETMLQRREAHKYHSQRKWSNTCCSHQMPGEDSISAAHRRLKEEMGFDCEMREVFTFKYHADVGNGLTEREYDHIIFGFYNEEPRPNKNEVEGWRWVSLERLKEEIKKNPEAFTPWLRLMVDKVIDKYREDNI